MYTQFEQLRRRQATTALRAIFPMATHTDIDVKMPRETTAVVSERVSHHRPPSKQ